MATYPISASPQRTINRLYPCLRKTIQCCLTSRTAGWTTESNHILVNISYTSRTFVLYDRVQMPRRRMGTFPFTCSFGGEMIYRWCRPLPPSMDFNLVDATGKLPLWHLRLFELELDVVHQPRVNTKHLTYYRDLRPMDLETAQLTTIFPYWLSSKTYLSHPSRQKWGGCQLATGKPNSVSRWHDEQHKRATNLTRIYRRTIERQRLWNCCCLRRHARIAI